MKTPCYSIQHIASALLLVLLLSPLFLIANPAASAKLAGITERVSVSSTGEQGNRESEHPSISADGRFVAFSSMATSLVSGDTNGVKDIFVHDRQSGVTERVSVNSTGEEGNSSSNDPSLSADGRFVAFMSDASNLVEGDTNGWADIFVHDRQTGLTERVSVSSTGEQGNNWSRYPALSAEGRFVAFESVASNLARGDKNLGGGVFVHDRLTGETELVSVNSTGEAAGFGSEPAISAGGRFVAFDSYAANLVSGDTNNLGDVFVHDRQTGVTERVSVSSTGEQGDNTSFRSALSADGRFVAFMSYASNLAAGDSDPQLDIFVHDRQSGLTELASVSTDGKAGNDYSYNPALSADGRFVAFESFASNLVHGDTRWAADIFVRDRQTGVTQRVSVSSTGDPGDFHSHLPALSAEGRFVAFSSDASNLVEGDTNFFCGDFKNNCGDVFVYDRCPGGECPKAHSYLPVTNR